MTPVYIEDFGVLTAQAKGKAELFAEILNADRNALKPEIVCDSEYYTARCPESAKTIVKECSWTNSVLSYLTICCSEIKETVEKNVSLYGANRIGVVLGTSGYGSDGVYNSEKYRIQNGVFPEGYELSFQQVHKASDFIQDYFGLTGYSGCITTACASGAHAVIEGVKLIQSGLADVVIAGGADDISESVLKGFISLEAADHKKTIPFSKNRRGINMGEGASLLVLTRKKPDSNVISVAGYGETSDAHHITAPDPDGLGAADAMRNALDMAGLKDVDYMNLHGTGTPLNDKMEGRASDSVFQTCPLCSSTKAVTGHTLGASGAVELGICWLMLSEFNKENRLPPHRWDGEPDPEIPEMNFCDDSTKKEELNTAMSNSYAFGGWNVSVILKKDSDK